MTDLTALPGPAAIATSAIHRSVDQLARDAHVVANSQGVEMRDTVAAMIDARQQVLYTKAAARIISASDQMTRALLDIHA
jgi:hypothetical protein